MTLISKSTHTPSYRIAFLAKWPPIQGGVARTVFQTVRQLDRLGHECVVVTNGLDVEHTNKIHFLEDDFFYLKNQFGPRTRVVEALASGALTHHIPSSTTTETRLFGAAMEALKECQPDVIVGWYFQPYGIVGAWLSAALGVPLIVIQAGSDVGRLCQHPHLVMSYQYMLKTAHSFLGVEHSWGHLGNTIKSLLASKCVPMRGKPEKFAEELAAPPPHHLECYLKKGPPWLETIGVGSKKLELLMSGQTQPLVGTNTVRILSYGKVGPSKGTPQLIDALAQLANEGHNFSFVFIPIGPQKMVAKALDLLALHPQLCRKTQLCPPVPFWRIPSLVGSSHICVFLENNFEVEAHASTVPWEMLYGGSGLVVSQDQVDRSPFLSRVAQVQGCFPVDTSRSGNLAQVLGFAITNEEKRKMVGATGRAMALAIHHAWIKDSPLYSTTRFILDHLENRSVEARCGTPQTASVFP